MALCAQNPDISSPPNAGLNKAQKADFPEEKKKEFEGTPGGYSWISAKDTSLLDYEGCEMVLIGAKGEIEGAALLMWLLNASWSQSIPEHRRATRCACAALCMQAGFCAYHPLPRAA